MRSPAFAHKPLFDLIALSLLLALLFGFGLGDRPYSAPSESRYIEIGREMAESGDFVTPRLNYVKYFEKPPLFYWIQAESTRLFGIAPFAARVPTACFALLLCLLTYGLARMLYGRLAGWLGALTLATSLYMFALSRIVLLDVPVSFFLAATLTAFLYAAHAPPGRARTLVIYAMYVAGAGAVLTKGLIGAVLPGAVIFLWLAFTSRWALLKEMRLISGTVFFLILTVPWHILVAQRNPEWAWFYFIHEHVLRFATDEAGRTQPAWFFAAVLLAGWFPWIVFLWQACKSGLLHDWQEFRSELHLPWWKRPQNDKRLFLALWIGVIFIFFSLSGSKLIPYILPIFPPLAALLGRYFARAWEERSAPGFGWGLTGLLLLLVAMAIVPSMLLNFLDADNKIAVALAKGGDELRTLSVACIIAAGLLLIVHVQGRRKHTLLTMFAVAAVILQLGDAVGAHYNKDSMQMFANILKSVHKPGDEVAMYQVYYQDMPVYLGGRVTLVDAKTELDYGKAHEDVSAWMTDAPAFWQRWLKNDHRMFLIVRDDGYARITHDKTPDSLHLIPVQKDGRNMLFMNRPAITPEKKP